MLFNSIEFILFLLIVAVLYVISGNKLRLIILLISSYTFYSFWEAKYLLLIVFTTFSSFLLAKFISKSSNRSYKRIYLFLALFINFLILFTFKYFNFFNQSINDLATLLNFKYNSIPINVLLPVGISFYTFQALSYIIDIYRGDTPLEKNYFRYSLFVAFFPQLVAGPIERSYNLLPQLKTLSQIKYSNVSKGFKLILWGLFIKIVIADRLAIVVNNIYNNVPNYNSVSYLIATLFFTYQIYLDFSGYSNIAIGVAKLFNIDLMENFRRPYFSKSVTEFWSRWHISLSTWFKDYLYIPLGGNRVSKQKWMMNILIVFIISGLWHGANYTFIVWGAIHGIFLIIERFFIKKEVLFNNKGLSYISILRWLYTYVVVVIAWIFFRANTLNDALIIIKSIFSKNIFQPLSNMGLGTIPKLLGISAFEVILSFAFIVLFIIISFITRKKGLVQYLESLNKFERWLIYFFATILILWFGKFGLNEFVYFQF